MSTCVILSLGGGVFDQLPRKNRETIRDKLPPYEGDIVLPTSCLPEPKPLVAIFCQVVEAILGNFPLLAKLSNLGGGEVTQPMNHMMSLTTCDFGSIVYLGVLNLTTSS